MITRKKLFLAAVLLAAYNAVAQSNFDPLVADQMRHLKQQIEELQKQQDEISLRLGVAPTPPPTDAGKVWRNERTGETRVDRLSPDYERNRAAALAKYEQDLARFNAGQEERRQNELRKQQLEQELEQQRQAEFARAVARSKAEAVRLYPDAGIDGTPLSKKMIEIADRLEAQGNTLVYQADAPLKVAQMAANELGIAPEP